MTVGNAAVTKRTVNAKSGAGKPSVAVTKAASKVTGTATSAKAAQPPVVSTLASREDYFVQIQKEAYFLAEKDDFTGDPATYWLAAEANVNRRMKSR